MKVRLRLYTILARYAPTGPQDASTGSQSTLELPDGSTVQDAVNILAIPREFLMLAIVNGKTATMESVLKDGDTLEFLPPISGG